MTKMMNDLERFYDLVGTRQHKLGKMYDILDGHEDATTQHLVDVLLEIANLTPSQENILAVLGRVINLREEAVVQALDAIGIDKKEAQEIRHNLYEAVKEYHTKSHEVLLKTVEQEGLLSPFYRVLLRGVHRVGEVLSSWQPLWTRHIIEDINEELAKTFENSSAVMEMLHAQNLLDTDHKGEAGDRSYSVLQRDEKGGYKSVAYAVAFKEEVLATTEALSDLIEELEGLDDPDFNQKEAYITYFDALRTAFLEEDTSRLIGAWANVDRAWMSVTAPIQVGHPLEYYEDHYKKAVALEWDVRLSDPRKQGAAGTKANIFSMYEKMFMLAAGENHANVYAKSVANIERVQLYIGRPALYYGAEFNGLFSAQVVPNDEVVSQEFGKKIFAFSDNVLDSIKAKPFLKIHKDVFGESFLNFERELVFKKSSLWHQVYEATTIGHEFGHVLWMDESTEQAMNKGGMFKNIEEFKATTGGLVAFFLHEEAPIKHYVMSDTIKRAVGLVTWMKTGEVEPYYCEGLIHLSGLFESGVLSFDGALHVSQGEKAYNAMKAWYLKTYQALGEHYLAKKDAALFLEKYAQKNKEGYFLPTDPLVREFVEYYWDLHCKIGRVIDETSNKAEWL